MLTDVLDISGVLGYWQDVVIGSLLVGSVHLDNIRRGEGFL
jgi:ribose/xylose/arabinose/galactoside ABC-type transport system permease subunit